MGNSVDSERRRNSLIISLATLASATYLCTKPGFDGSSFILSVISFCTGLNSIVYTDPKPDSPPSNQGGV